MRAEFENRDAARIVGLSPRVLIDWSERGIIVPDIQDAAGVGSRRKYSEGNLVELEIVKTLLADGIKREAIKRVITLGKAAPHSWRRVCALSDQEWKEAGVEQFLVIDLNNCRSTLVFHRTKFPGDKVSEEEAERIQQDQLAKLGGLVRQAGRAYVLNLNDLKERLRQGLEQ